MFSMLNYFEYKLIAMDLFIIGIIKHRIRNNLPFVVLNIEHKEKYFMHGYTSYDS
jgi:hypothetical protein